MKYFWKLFAPFVVILFLTPIVFGDVDGPIVHLKDGQVRGIEEEVDGNKINFYNGIRYGMRLFKNVMQIKIFIY